MKILKNSIKRKFIKYLRMYQKVMCITIQNIKSKQIHDIRKHLRNKGEIIIIKTSIFKYYFATELKKNVQDWNETLVENLGGKICLLFTNMDPRHINKIIDHYFILSFAKTGKKAQKNIKIKKGIKPLNPSETPFFQALGIETRVSKGSIDIINNLLLVKENAIISASHSVLLKKLNIRPLKYGMKIVKIFSKKFIVDLDFLNCKDITTKTNSNKCISFLNHFMFGINYNTLLSLPFNVIYSFESILSLVL